MYSTIASAWRRWCSSGQMLVVGCLVPMRVILHVSPQIEGLWLTAGVALVVENFAYQAAERRGVDGGSADVSEEAGGAGGGDAVGGEAWRRSGGVLALRRRRAARAGAGGV